MHGRIKVYTSAEQEEIKKKEQAKKVIEYRSGINFIFQKRKEKSWNHELLGATEKVLVRNADIYTLWNIRREVLINNNWSKIENEEQLEKELMLTENCLRENPKSYSVWHHRCWVIDHIIEPNYRKELLLCTKCLNIDERNFHCWDYRNFIVQKAGVADNEEFEFSTAKILNNFSNYSSWHYRSKILSKMFPDVTHTLPIEINKHKEELDLVMQATFTDPNDTSAWFYQRWLLECGKSLTKKLWRAKLTTTDALVVFHDNVSIESPNISLSIDGNILDCQWKSVNNEKFSKLWITKFHHPLNITDNSVILLNYGTDIYPFELLNSSWICKTELPLNEKSNEIQLREQLVNYKQLSEMEPQNKWALLTGIFLMQSIDVVEFRSSILCDIDLLLTVDKMRCNYYKDLRSKCLIDNYLFNFSQDENENCRNCQANLSGLGLTILYKENYLSFLQEINLDSNNLGNCLQRLSSLIECKKLSLSNNGVSSTEHFPILPKLEVLTLRSNDISSVEDVFHLLKQNNLSELDIRDNPVSKLDAKQFENMLLSTNVIIK
ncbi:geranylgeranyl transferase type-2 subunit alpha [Leptopilina heterotoma]|uniref:geranylgeranyl transferase type-2 subunit alpha n=1 Tax=Leptopilina heterotoma TaxID=63436 RepID=UPI001CA8A988|nr:geranylgeranyl transferase type-2 subunit alpha [Leptopilina heterotoma]